MAQPPKDIQAKLRQMADEERIRKQLKAQYEAEMAKRYSRDIVPFAQWMSDRNQPGMAGGGKVKAPKSTVKAYKLFRVDERQPGKLFPLFVDANTPVKMGEWVDAIEGSMANGKVKSKIGPLAYRPGWHAGDLPIATHIGEKSDPSITAPDTRPANHAWAEVEMPNDVDWQTVANQRGTNAQGKLVPVKAHITDQLPKGGHYRYKTNSNMTGNWLIGGSMKVNRVLSDAEVAKINKAAGLADLPRAQPFKKKVFGFAGGGAVGPQEWMAEEHVNHKGESNDDYEHGWFHGTTGDIQAFDPGMMGETTGAPSAKKGFFFARDPVNPPAHMRVKSSDPATIQMLLNSGMTKEQIDKLNQVSFKGHGAETAAQYAGMGGSRTYKEAVRKAKAAEAKGNWDEYERQMQIAEDSETANWNERQLLVAKYGEKRDLMLDALNRAIWGKLPKEDEGFYPTTDIHRQVMSRVVHTPEQTEALAQAIRNRVLSHKSRSKEESEAAANEAIQAFMELQKVGHERRLVENVNSGANVIPVKLRYKNPMVHDFNGESYRDESYSDLIDKAVRGGHDSVILQNTYDPGAGTPKLVDIGIMFEPNQIKSVFNKKPTKHPDITKAAGGTAHMADGGTLPANPSLDTMKLALTRNNLGMHSPLEKSLINVPRTKGTAQEFMTEASKQPGFKKEEVDDRAIPMPEGKLTREQFVSHIKNHQGKPLVVDVRYGDEGNTHHDEYTIPGGENYREILLKQPQWNGNTTLMQREAELRRTEEGKWSEHLKREIAELKASKEKYGEVYPGNPYHFGREPGVHASLMVKDRVGPNGEKILHIDELQSDWHQEGRKFGYEDKQANQKEFQRLGKLLREVVERRGETVAVPGKEEEYKQLAEQEEDLRNQINRLDKNKNAVPHGPYKKSWHELALKHALTEAVKGGYHGIAISPGEVLADRYSMSNHIDEINVTGRTNAMTGEKSKSVALDTKSGQSLRLGVSPDGTIDNVSNRSISNYIGKGLDEVIGKELAQKIMQGGTQTIAGEGLKVGGEGMKGFYDKMVPDFLNKLGKKHGAQVMPMGIPQQWKHNDEKVVANLIAEGTDPEDLSSDQFADARDRLKGVEPPPHKVHYFPITPSLRQQIKTEGLPQYQRGGMIHKATGGAIQGTTMNPTMAQMRASLMRKPMDIRTVGVQEAIGLSPKLFMSPDSGVERGQMPPPGGVATPSGMPIGGIDMSMQPGQQLMPQMQQPQQPGMQPQGGQQAPQMAPDQPSNILQMTPQGQAMNAIRPPQQPMQPQRPPGMAKGGRLSTEQMAAELMSKASRSAGMKAPVTATKSLTTMDDFRQSLGDRVSQGASDMQNLIESMPHKYEPGQHVFTKDSAKKNKRPYKIVAKYPFGNQPMREDHPQLGPGMGKVIKDAQTGKAKRTPYEPGYKVRHEMGPDEFSEFHIPESAILGEVKLAGGGQPKKMTVEQQKQAIFQANQAGLMTPSEVLGKHEGKYLHLTEADRAKVEKRKHGMRGGVGFSQIGLEDPEYAGRVWGVGKSGTAIKLLNKQKRGLSPEDQSIWSTFIGSPEMHTSNQLVFNRMWNKFQEARKQGLLSPDQEQVMLEIMRSAMTKGTKKSPAKPVFNPDVTFDNTHHLFDTFERRRILSDLMAGKKIGGKKGQIFDASKMIEETTDPRLLHAPTFSVGPHLFSMSGKTSLEPKLNKAFPFMLHGETSPEAFRQIPFELAAPDYVSDIKKSKGRDPGYMDIVRSIPRQQITDKYLTALQKQGYKKGGKVAPKQNVDTMRLALTKKAK